MIRTRIMWFSFGFVSTSAAIAQFVYKDLWSDRNFLALQLQEKFNSLDSRVINLESMLLTTTDSSQD